MNLAPFSNVYVNATGAFYPGEPVDNTGIDDCIVPLNPGSSRLKRRILAENGIQQRYYFVGPDGRTRFSAAYMAAAAIHTCLGEAGASLSDIDLLCTGTSGGDATVPGFANMVQGELAAPPMMTSSHSGVCAAGIAALQHAAMALDGGRAQRAVVATSEMPSRLFKRSRFASRGYDIDFDAHFLRWMLSDAAGAWLVESAPHGDHPLKLIGLHLRSFSGDYPVCMQVGPAAGSSESYLDYASFADAEKAGAYALRQNVRLLRDLAEVWHDYRSRAWRTPLVSRITRGGLAREHMLRWMEDWIPQVQQGSLWMRKAAANLGEPYAKLRDLILIHAADEQFDFRILFDDYRRLGGTAPTIEALRRNPGGEALNAYLHARAGAANPVGLLGAVYIIEGTGQRIVPALLPEIRRQLALPIETTKFLQYHGENDVNHLARWLHCVEMALDAGGGTAAADIVATARTTAQLYLMQLESVL